MLQEHQIKMLEINKHFFSYDNLFLAQLSNFYPISTYELGDYTIKVQVNRNMEYRLD